jgi:nitrogen regulatory protein P-II 1
MVKIEAVIQPFKLDEAKALLDGLGIEGITICEVLNHSTRETHKATYRGAEYRVDVPRVKLEMLVSSVRADEIVDALLRVARTGVSGDDGTIMLYEVADAVRIHTGERLQFALS